MDQHSEDRASAREILKNKLRENFDGKIVRKDLTKKIKEGANVPVYVLEFLLGQYCSIDDEALIEKGVETVKRILADNFVRPDEAQKILSMLRSRGSYTVIDKITVSLNIKKDVYEAEFSNLGLKAVPISEEYPEKYDRLLCGGIWCIVQLDYEYIEEEKNASPIHIRKLTPIQMPHVDIRELKQGRKAFTKEEWMDVMLRSIGMEPDSLKERENGCSFCVCCRWSRTTLTSASSAPAVPANRICSKRFPQTASWFPADRRRLQTCSTTWRRNRSAWSACGTAWPVTRWPAATSRTKTASRS